MKPERVQAFSDGVIAIIITIMVLELAAPLGDTWGDLAALWPKLVGYLVSFVYVGICWNNHHHVFQAVRVVSGSVLWANLALLFALSLFPLGTAWVGDSHFAPAPMSFYALVALAMACTYGILVFRLIRADPANHRLARATGSALKERASIGGYLIAAVVPAFGTVGVVVAAIILVAVAVIWVVPDRRIERALRADDGSVAEQE